MYSIAVKGPWEKGIRERLEDAYHPVAAGRRLVVAYGEADLFVGEAAGPAWAGGGLEGDLVVYQHWVDLSYNTVDWGTCLSR